MSTTTLPFPLPLPDLDDFVEFRDFAELLPPGAPSGKSSKEPKKV